MKSSLPKLYLLLGGWTVVVVLRVIFYGVFVRVVLPIVLFLLFGCSSDRVFIVFGVTWRTILSGAGVAVL